MLRLMPAGPSSRAPSAPRVDPLRALAAAAAAGDATAQQTFLIETGSSLLRTVRAVLGPAHPEVEDVLQETMTAVHLALPGFRGECSTLHFACRIAVQSAMNARRRARTRARHLSHEFDEELAELARDGESPADLLAAARRRSVLRELLGELPEAQAEVLALHTILGHTVEETAQITGAPLNTVRSRLRAALSALRRAAHSDGKRFAPIRDDA